MKIFMHTVIGILLLVLCLAVLPITGQAASNSSSWKLEDGTLTIYKDMSDTDSPLPWYEQRNTITTVVIQPGVTRIENWAFADCTNLTSVTIPDSVTTIGEYAFLDCTNLVSVSLPDSATAIGSHAFDSCSSLESISLPDGLTKISSCLFSRCTNLSSVILPPNITTIENYAFERCTNLSSVTIPASVTQIELQVFDRCTKLREIHITDLVAWSNIEFHVNYQNDTSTLYNNTGLYLNGELLTDIVLPEGVTEVSAGAFSDYQYLHSITLPESVTKISQFAFRGCSNLTSITLPASIEKIASDAFYECDSLAEVKYNGTIFHLRKLTIIEAGNENLLNLSWEQGPALESITTPLMTILIWGMVLADLAVLVIVAVIAIKVRNQKVL